MTDIPTIRAISFDGDGTLWDFQQVMHNALRFALAERRAVAPGPGAGLTIEAMIAIRNGVAEELQGHMTNLEAVRLAAFERTLQHIGVVDAGLAVRLNAVYLQHRFADTRPYDDVLPTLDALRGRYRLGLLSNGNSHPERCGLPDRFSFVVFAQDHGYEKPDRRLFEVALAQAGCEPQELLHVGDSLANDVAGAQGAGVRSVWLNRDGRGNDSTVRPDFEITSLTELRRPGRGDAWRP
ncbi:MAG TPA: HAD family hydrolase [Chloroflexota bacterium]|nr:HAD family hydrolase [Chloroflexota bacterium]